LILKRYGCVDDIACNYNELATEEDGTCIYAIGCDYCSGETDGSGTLIDGDTDDDGTCDVPGCMDITACNYNSAATVDDLTCILVTGNCDSCSGIQVKSSTVAAEL
jgi:hypothetical protein